MDKIKMLDGECWWGGKVPSGCDMPFDENSDCTFDIESRVKTISPHHFFYRRADVTYGMTTRLP